MEAGWDFSCIDDSNCFRQLGVQDLLQLLRVKLLIGFESSDLAFGMNATVGSARALNDCIRRQIRTYAQAHLPDFSEYTLYCDPDVWGDHLQTSHSPAVHP